MHFLRSIKVLQNVSIYKVSSVQLVTDSKPEALNKA